jgi:hypothetical protein
VDRRFPKRDPEIEAMYPGHLLPSSPQMLKNCCGAASTRTISHHLSGALYEKEGR